MKTSSLLADVRALGVGAPIRVLYELSKRLGLHRLLLRGAHDATLATATTRLGPLGTMPDQAQERAVVAAGLIADGILELFGRRIPGQLTGWHSIIDGDGEWPSRPWWEIDIRSDRRPGDVKWVWELGRHRHLLLLARAAYLETAQPRFLDELQSQLRSWQIHNPPEMGVHWYSNLELSLRAVCWLQIQALVGHRLDVDLIRRMNQDMYHMGRHLLADLPYTISAMRNNHLIGDALGLVALGKTFSGDRRADRWVRWGDRLLEIQLRNHFRADGSSIEDSISYDRFVLEMLIVRSLLGGPPSIVHKSIRSSAQYLCRFGTLKDVVPQVGDWDGGRVLSVSHGAEDLRGSIKLALALSGTGAPSEWAETHDEIAWYAPEGVPLPADAPERDGFDVGGDMGRAHRGRWTAWLKAGSGRSHGHADLLSTPILFGGHWLVGDPGTGTYNGPVEQRNYFRSSIAHNVARVRGIDQLQPHRVFRWKYRARGRLGQPIQNESSVLMWGTHDAYTRLQPPVRVVRTVLVDVAGIGVVDWIEHDDEWRLSLTLPPDVEYTGDALVGPSGEVALWSNAPMSSVKGESDPFDGWWSDTYGHMVPTARLEMAGRGPLIIWALGDVVPEVTGSGAVTLGEFTVKANFAAAVTVTVSRIDGSLRELSLYG